jgi:hypothetical protein
LDGLDFDFLSNIHTEVDGKEGEGLDFSGWADSEHHMHQTSSDSVSHSQLPKLRKDSTISQVDDSFERNRKGSIDALMNDALLDDIHAGHYSTHDDVDLDLNGVFHQFAEEEGSPRSPRGEKLKKSLRLLAQDHFASSDISPDKVDLSAYASHAASLQQQNLEKKFITAADVAVSFNLIVCMFIEFLTMKGHGSFRMLLLTSDCGAK